jgi:predicted TIM-barrel fold metal-dependent hydrolase
LRGGGTQSPASPAAARAEALNVPIYLHPTVPAKPVLDVLYGGFSPMVSATFAAAGWGWHIETAVHLNRIILGGVFDRYPKLQVVIGHLGEGLPFMLPRLNKRLPMEMTKLARPLGAYLRENVHYTIAGFNFPATFLDLLLEVGVERISSRPTIHTDRWRKRVRFWTIFSSAPQTGNASRTAMRSGFSSYRQWSCAGELSRRAAE